MNDFLSQKIKALEEYTPNTTIFPVRLDANESPYQISDTLRQKFSEIITYTEFNRYPDPYTSELVEKYSRLIGVGTENVVSGNGSDELISIICNSFLSKSDKVIVTIPDFSMYAFYSGLIEAELAEYLKPNGYEIDFDALSDMANKSGAKAVLLSNPCNPTSKLYDRQTILQFIRKTNCLCVIDEAYMDFASSNESLIDRGTLDTNPNLIILKTLSKLGLAALRCGFAISNKTLIDGIKKVKSPYNVNTLTQKLASAALTDYDEFAKHIKEVKADTLKLYETLKKISDKGCYATIKPDTNFVTLWFENSERAKEIFLSLRESGISIRYTLGRCLRITCGTCDENSIFLEEFNKLI